MDLLEIEEKHEMRREEAAKLMHRIADALQRQNDLEFVREISSRVIVLHQGKILLDGSVGEVVGSELVRDIYAGTAQDGGDGDP